MFLRTIKIQQVTMERMALGIEFMIPFSNDDFYVYARRQASAESFADMLAKVIAPLKNQSCLSSFSKPCIVTETLLFFVFAQLAL